VWTRLPRSVPDAPASDEAASSEPASDENNDERGIPDSVLTLTAIILLLRPLDVWWVTPFILMAACLSLLSRAVRRTPVTWIVVALLVTVRIVVVWPLSDNHIYLLAYWCLAIGLALSGATPAATLSTSSRWLLAGAFAMAVLWKAALSPDYVDGRFFRVTLLTDERFADASLVFGGLSREQMAQNRAFLEPLPEGAELLTPPPFVEPPRLRAFAAAATWGGLILEGLIALTCLIPASGWLAIARHGLLLSFCVTTYALAPVAGFGWLIATMGLAQCHSRQRVLRAAYVAVFILILMYSEVPWAGVLADWAGR
jgi:hypothetical protein